MLFHFAIVIFIVTKKVKSDNEPDCSYSSINCHYSFNGSSEICARKEIVLSSENETSLCPNKTFACNKTECDKDCDLKLWTEWSVCYPNGTRINKRIKHNAGSSRYTFSCVPMLVEECEPPKPKPPEISDNAQESNKESEFTMEFIAGLVVFNLFAVGLIVGVIVVVCIPVNGKTFISIIIKKPKDEVKPYEEDIEGQSIRSIQAEGSKYASGSNYASGRAELSKSENKSKNSKRVTI